MQDEKDEEGGGEGRLGSYGEAESGRRWVESKRGEVVRGIWSGRTPGNRGGHAWPNLVFRCSLDAYKVGLDFSFVLS